jgi:hypothetical protein
MLDDPFCPVAPDVRRQLELAIDALGKAGARLTQGWPAGLRIAEWYGAYFTMLGSAVLPNDPTARRCWADYFRDHDAFPMPVDFVTALPHDHSPDMWRVRSPLPPGCVLIWTC